MLAADQIFKYAKYNKSLQDTVPHSIMFHSEYVQECRKHQKMGEGGMAPASRGTFG
jgi:hypothetical protein